MFKFVKGDSFIIAPQTYQHKELRKFLPNIHSAGFVKFNETETYGESISLNLVNNQARVHFNDLYLYKDDYRYFLSDCDNLNAENLGQVELKLITKDDRDYLECVNDKNNVLVYVGWSE